MKGMSEVYHPVVNPVGISHKHTIFRYEFCKEGPGYECVDRRTEVGYEAYGSIG